MTESTQPRYIAESFRGQRWFVTDTKTNTIVTDVATGEETARAVAADMNARQDQPEPFEVGPFAHNFDHRRRGVK